MENIDVEDVFERFIREYQDGLGNIKYNTKLGEMIAYTTRSLYIDFSDLINFNADLASLIIQKPIQVLPMLEERLMKILTDFDSNAPEHIGRVHIRFTNIPNIIPLRKLSSTHINKLVSIEGIITKQTPVKERIYKLTLKHKDPNTGDEHEFEWPDEGEIKDIILMPTSCPICNKPGKFRQVDGKDKVIDWQKAILQEKPEEVPPGQLPRQIEVIFEDDVVDTVRPGDRVKLTGIYTLKHDQIIREGVNPVFDSYLKVIGVEVSQKAFDEVMITDEDKKTLKEMASNPWIREIIISSIAPSIFGHWEIKEAISLALFGGVARIMPDGTRTRGDIHILLLGDPGTAKSQILQFVYRVAPRAVYTTGRGATAAGLTATVTKEKDVGDFYLEAGALVLADGGVAVIDEIDKMRAEDRTAIHEAMEQQTVSIAKAGIVAKLNARTTIIAAGNPRFGRYIPDRGLAENIDLTPAILSRFDLIFVLTDRPNDNDIALATHIVKMHREIAPKPYIPSDLLRKYIVYARQNINPALDDDAQDMLTKYYVKIRKRSLESEESPVMITPRQLEALIRLTEAYARMRLSPVATKEDAERAINITETFLSTIGVDTGTGSIDIDSLMTGKSKSIRDKTIELLGIIDSIASDKGCAQLKNILDEAKRVGIGKQDVDNIISNMKKSALILEVKAECYKKV